MPPRPAIASMWWPANSEPTGTSAMGSFLRLSGTAQLSGGQIVGAGVRLSTVESTVPLRCTPGEARPGGRSIGSRRSPRILDCMAAKTSDKLTEQRRRLPDQPGVYLFRDAKGRVL